MATNNINIKDEEIIIHEDNFFDSTKYVTELKSRIKNNDFFNVIGLYGEWGIGKSSIIKTVINDCNNDYHFVLYDAWKHNEDSIKRSFLIELMEKTNYPKNKKNETKKRLYEENSVENENEKINGKILTMSISIIVYIVYLFSKKHQFNNDIVFNSVTILLAIEWIWKFIDRYKEKTKINNKKLPIKSTEEYEKIYKDIIAEIAEEKRVIVIIDNLDRCNADMSYRMLTELKTFMSQEKRVTIIIPLDEEAIKSHIKKSLGISDCEVNEYLIKIINSSISIKEASNEKIYRYINELCEKNSVFIKEQTKIVISELQLNNPRKIISFINNLCNELNLFTRDKDKTIKEKDEYLFAIVLYIKEKFPDIYNTIKNREMPTKEDWDRNLNFPAKLKKYLSTRNINTMYYIVHHEMGYITKFTSEERKSIIDKESFENINYYNNHELLNKIINELKSGINMKDELTRKIVFIYYEKMIEILNKHTEDNYLYEEFYELNTKIPKVKNTIIVGQQPTKDSFYCNIKNKEQYINYAIRCYKNNKNDMLDHLFNYIETEKDENMILKFLEYNKETNFLNKISKTVTLKTTESPEFIKKIKVDLIPIIYNYSNLTTYTDCFMNGTVNLENYQYLLDNLSDIDIIVKEDNFSDFLDFFILKINHAILFPSDTSIHLNELIPITKIIKNKLVKTELKKSKNTLIHIISKLKINEDCEIRKEFYNIIREITDDNEVLKALDGRSTEIINTLSYEKRF